MTTLACGPFFSQIGLGVSLVALLVVKPLTYVAFIQAFRFRVSRGIPMSVGRATGLAAARTAIDVAFDAAMGLSLLEEWVIVVGIALAMIAFIVPLTLIGRRDSLKARFTRSGVRRQCEYDLTGNLSGQCPECGTPIAASRLT